MVAPAQDSLRNRLLNLDLEPLAPEPDCWLHPCREPEKAAQALAWLGPERRCKAGPTLSGAGPQRGNLLDA